MALFFRLMWCSCIPMSMILFAYCHPRAFLSVVAYLREGYGGLSILNHSENYVQEKEKKLSRVCNGSAILERSDEPSWSPSARKRAYYTSDSASFVDNVRLTNVCIIIIIIYNCYSRTPTNNEQGKGRMRWRERAGREWEGGSERCSNKYLKYVTAMCVHCET